MHFPIEHVDFPASHFSFREACLSPQKKKKNLFTFAKVPLIEKQGSKNMAR